MASRILMVPQVGGFGYGEPSSEIFVSGCSLLTILSPTSFVFDGSLSSTIHEREA